VAALEPDNFNSRINKDDIPMDTEKKNKKELDLNQAEFSTLMMYVKSVQSGYFLFKQFDEEFKTLKKQDINVPENISPIFLAKSFFTYIKQTHPYPHQLNDTFTTASTDDINVKIGVLERYLHAIDKIDPNFFDGSKHKQDCRNVIIQVLEDFYDELEDLEDEEEEGLFLIDDEGEE
jgi:hypothetical protein